MRTCGERAHSGISQDGLLTRGGAQLIIPKVVSRARRGDEIISRNGFPLAAFPFYGLTFFNGLRARHTGEVFAVCPRRIAEVMQKHVGVELSYLLNCE
jgi:hypothetical protein